MQAGTAISFYFDQMLLLLLLLLLPKVLKRFSETDVRAANITPACILAWCFLHLAAFAFAWAVAAARWHVRMMRHGSLFTV